MFHRRFLGLLVLASLVLGMVGPPVPPTHKVQAQDAHTQAVAVDDGPVSVVTADDMQTVDVSHTTGTGTSRLLLVGVSWNSNVDARSISSVTFSYGAGPTVLSLNQAISRKYSANYRYATIWYSPTEPPYNTSGTVTVTFAEGIVSAGIIVGVANLAGVDVTAPIGVSNGADASSSAPSVTLTGLDGDEFVFDTIFAGGNPPATLDLAGTGQTQLAGWNSTIVTARGAASTEAAGGNTSVTMSWVPSASGIWTLVAAAIHPTCTGTTYTLTAGNDGHGTVTPASGTSCNGRAVTLTPVPAVGYAFIGWVGANASEIVNTGGVYTIAMNGNKSVTANFAPKPCSTDAPFTALEDTYLSAAAATTNYGSSTTLEVCGPGATDTRRRTALLRWNLSSIPTNATISSASLSLNVTDASATYYNLHDLMRAWGEGTATWNTYDGATSWTTAGAASTTSDRYNTNLWGAVAGSFTSAAPPEVKTVTLNSSGVAIVQGWVAGTGTNNGLIIQRYAIGVTDNLIFESSEGGTLPTLNISYCYVNNTAPALQQLVLPSIGATDVNLPVLRVQVHDADSNAMDVSFYGQAEGGGAADTSAQAFELLGTVFGVPSGGYAQMLYWPVVANTWYDWYVVISDGSLSTSTSTAGWRFQTGADPTGIGLAWFTASATHGGVRVTWETASDVASLGFHLWRATSANGERLRVTEDLIASQAPGSGSGGRYEFVDQPARAGVTYYYWLELVGVDGVAELFGPVSARAELQIKPPPARE